MKIKKKTATITIISITGVILLLLILMICSFVTLKEHPGVQSIKAREALSSDGFTFKINYFDASAYIVEKFDKSQTIYQGEKPISINDDLGEYLIKITICDTAMSDKLSKKYSPMITYPLNGTDEKVKFMWNYNSSHGVDFYLGCDEPLSVEEERVDCFDFGTITIHFYFK